MQSRYVFKYVIIKHLGNICRRIHRIWLDTDDISMNISYPLSLF